VFCREYGRPYHPDHVQQSFQYRVAADGRPEDLVHRNVSVKSTLPSN
jgi:hypothetical protein